MDGDTTSVSYRRQIETAVIIETRRSGRRDVFAESFSQAWPAHATKAVLRQAALGLACLLAE